VVLTYVERHFKRNIYGLFSLNPNINLMCDKNSLFCVQSNLVRELLGGKISVRTHKVLSQLKFFLRVRDPMEAY